MKTKVLMSFCLLLLTAGAHTVAQVLDMPTPTEPQMDEAAPQPMEAAPQEMETSPQEYTVPGRGMTMDQVETRFGAPSEKYDAVGDPPITRWVYSGFTVYFEYDKVIHSVIHKH